MRFLGFLFLLALVVAAVGYFQGWFSFSTSKAGDRRSFEGVINDAEFERDTRQIRDKLDAAASRVVEKIRSLGRGVSADETRIEGTVTDVDAAQQRVTVNASSETLVLHVPSSVTVTDGGRTVAFAEVRQGDPVEVLVRREGEGWRLVRLELKR